MMAVVEQRVEPLDAAVQIYAPKLNVGQFHQTAAHATGRAIVKAMGRITNEGDTALRAPITVLTNDTGNLTKTFSLDEHDKVQKQAAAKLIRGAFEVHYVQNLAQLDTLLAALKSTQAVTYGRPSADTGKVVAQNVSNPPVDAVTRTRDNFQFAPGAGVLMLDYDPPKDAPAIAMHHLIDMLCHACVPFGSVGMLWRPSASSGVAGDDVRGQRVYIIINDASQIPRIGKAIFDRLWLAGFGYYAISKSGQLLERSPIDASVWKPEGLDFAAAPVLMDGISRTSYKSQIVDGDILDADAIEDLSPAEETALKMMKVAARDAKQPEIKAIKDEFIAKAKPALAARLKGLGADIDDKSISVLLDRATRHQTLMGNWPLTTRYGMVVTVGEVIDNPDKWHCARFADPLEPGDDKRVAYLNLRSGGRPYLYSHLHGGTRYTLDRAPALIQVVGGELPRMVDATAELLKKYGEIYERGGAMVYVNEAKKIVQAKAPWLVVQIQRLCRYERLDNKKKEWVPTDCPMPVVNGVLADAANLRMPKLTSVRNAPTMDSDGRQISTPGYDEKTGLLLIGDALDTWPHIPRAPTQDDLKKAFNELWKPFAQFPYAAGSDKSVALAAVLTAVVRACLRTAPGFGFSATAPGTGKTLLAQCVGALYDGVAPAVSTPISNEDEWAKSLFSSALAGTGTLLFDNAEYPIESASLCAVTTAPSIKGRVLGESREAEAEHRLLVMATGNGLQLIGDLNRRFFTCRLDANMEAAKIIARQFDIDPLSYCLKNRIKLVTAALTLIQGYAHAGFPRVCDGMASMDDWNKLVRSTIVWLVESGIAPGFVDPKMALTRDSSNDPDATLHANVIDLMKTTFGVNRPITVAELIERAKRQDVNMLDVLMDIAGDRDSVNAKKMGHWLLKREGRIQNGLCIKRGAPNRQKKATWLLCAA